MNTEEKCRIGYIKRKEYPDTIEYCSNCAYAHTKVGDPDDRPCSKHNMMVGAWDVCNDFEDWCEVTEEGRKWRAAVQNLATIHLKRLENEKKETLQKPKEKDITTPRFVAIGSLLGGTMFNAIIAFVAYKTGFIEWGIKQWLCTYIVAAIIVGVGNVLLGVLSKDL